MAEQWPEGVPDCFTVDSLEGGLGDNLLRSSNDQGPAKTRPRGTAMPDPIGGTIKMTRAEWETFRDWVKITLGGGALVFDLPWRGSTVEARFTGQPSFRRASPGVYLVNLPLELMP